METEMNNSAQVLNCLKRRLIELRRGESWAEYAKRVKVAPQTLAEIFNADVGAYQELSKRKASGRAGTLASVVRFANDGLEQDAQIDLYDVLRALELGGGPFQVGAGLARSTKMHLMSEKVEFRTHGDIVLSEIERRKIEGDKQPIKAGIDAWAPFFSRDIEDIGNSFAGKTMRRLLGCLSPEHWHEPELIELVYSKVLDADSVRLGNLDVIFSMYEIPSRRLEGFDFIRIPGLRAALGALAFRFDKKVTWERILDRDDLGATEKMRVFVISGEVGESFLSGSCDYREGQIIRLDMSVDAEKVSLKIWEHIDKQMSRGINSVDPILFCADVSIVNKVEEELRAIINREVDNGTKTDLFEQIRMIPPDFIFSPLYPIGIAVNGRAQRWRGILAEALQTEIFMNGGALTAKHYLEMLSRVDASSIEIISLTLDLPEHVALRFSKHISNALKSWRGDNDRKGKIQEIWVKPFLNARNKKAKTAG